MTDFNAARTREQLQQLEKEHGDLKTHLSIVRISEPIFSPESDSTSPSPSKRNSDVSAIDSPSPASLEADLTHYKVRMEESNRESIPERRAKQI